MIDTIWSSKLDGRYDCAVTRTDHYQGKLTIEDAGTVIFEQDVGLAYGAVFGPDVDDVAAWQDICCQEIDKKGAVE